MRSLLLATVAMTATGCNKVDCGEGTFADGDNCVAFDPNDKTPPVTTISPDGGRSRNPLPQTITLTTDERARIYFTTDGSDPDPATDPGHRDVTTVVDIAQQTTLRFFAIDAAGNREELRTATYESDTTAPSAPADVQVVMNGTTAQVTWSNPTDGDFAGVVVARVRDVIDQEPVPGEPLAAGAILSPSLDVLATGNVAQFADAGRSPGPVRYVVWAYDDLANYSNPVAATAELPIGSLTGTLTFANNALAVTAAPENFDLADSSAMLVGSTLTVTVRVKNNTNRYLNNPKVEVASTSNAAFQNATGTADNRPFLTLGPNMLAPGATATADLVFAVADINTASTIDVVLAHHPSLLGQRSNRELSFFDLGSGLPIPQLSMTAPGPGNRAGGRVRPSIITGGHFIDVATTHGFERFDLATRLRTKAVAIGDQTAIQSVFSTGSDLIAVVKRAGRRASGDSVLVRLDEGLNVKTQLVLPAADDQGFIRPALSPDKKTLAVPLIGGIALVDLATFTVIDQNPETPDPDLVDSGITSSMRTVMFINNTDLVVVGRRNGQATVLKKTARGYTVTLHQEAANTFGYGAVLAPDGRVWIAFSTGIRAYDIAANTFSTVAYPFVPDGISLVDGAVWITRNEAGRKGEKIDQVNATGGVVRTFVTAAFLGARGHWLLTAP
jgi:hypothetical protein